ncbi:MAG: ABC transporter ATP-binding protein [Ruminococcaceae bacterium]|nr:ABC transporter ATP-binding protein [Oscillospiraceae bacterium]
MIEVKDLVKQYGATTAVKGLSFTIENGKIYGLLGPNGAGKSTTMNIITGCLAATSGQVVIDGFDIFEQPSEAKKHIGYLPEQPPVYGEMTPKEYLSFVGEAKGLRGEELRRGVEKVMDLTGIVGMKNRLIRNLSKGYKQRVGLAQAILGDPETIILDEPTVGLDPKQIIEIRDLIRSLGKDHTVVLSSHILSEVSAVCDYILIISDGRLVAGDTPENLSAYMNGQNTVELKTRASEEQVQTVLSGIGGIREANVKASDEKGVLSLSITSEGETDLREPLFYAFAEAKCPILEMVHTSLSLEDIFLRLTDGSEDEADGSDLASESEEEEIPYQSQFTASSEEESEEENEEKEEK